MTRRVPWKILGVACAGSLTYGGTCLWMARQSAKAEVILDSSVYTAAATSSSSLVCLSGQEHVDGFHDANKFVSDNEWTLETSNFTYGPKPYGDVPMSTEERKKRDQQRLPVPAVEVLKLKTMNYDEQAFYQGSTPVLRIVGYFPDVTTREVCEQLTDTSLRMKWDANYRAFERLISLSTAPAAAGAASVAGLHGKKEDEAGESSIDSSRRELLDDVSKRIGNGLLDVSRELDGAVPTARGVVEDHAILAHRVASSKLEKVGVAGRYFCYERLVRRYDFPLLLPSSSSSSSSAAAFPREVFSIMYRSLPSGAVHRLIGATCPVSSQPKPTDVTVFMHAQEIILLPIFYDSSKVGATERGIVDLAVHRLHMMGGVEDSKANTSISNWIKFNTPAEAKRPLRRQAQAAKGGEGEAAAGRHEGVLMLMTAVNDGKMPQGLPRWAERLVAQYFTSATYSNLHSAILGSRGKEPPAAAAGSS